MAIAFTPKHIETISLGGLTHQQFLVFATEAIKRAGWDQTHLSAAGLIAYTNNGIMQWNAEVRIKIEMDSVTIQSASTGSDMIDLGKNKKTVGIFLTTLEEVKTSLSKEEADAKYLELKSDFVAPENDELLLPPPTATDKVTNFLSLFKPTNGYFITPILININLFVFIAMIVGGADIISPSSEVLLEWGANFRPMTLDGEWWRLITCCFLHIGVIHLLLNLFALMYIGVLLEPLLGRSRFAWAYFITGIFSML